jgi:LPXTG-motif cell wall-anchored protein
LRDPPGQGPGPACLNTRWRNYSDLYVTECLLVIANQQVASTGGTGEDNSGGGGQGGSGQDGSGGSAGNAGGTDGQGGSTGGASTAPGTSSVPASEAASPRSDAQPAGSSEAPALQQPATDVSPASAAASTMPPLPQVLPRTGQPQALTSLAGIGLVLLGCGVILLRRPARAR